jgi:hypothetical protein
MTYDPTQPKDLPPPATGVQSVKANFSQYATAFGNNHVPMNATYEGKHTNVILQQQGSDPINEGGFDSLYIKPIVSNLIPSEELFVRIPQFLPIDKPNIPMQLTFNIVNVAGPQYQSFLAGGYIIYWGTIPSAGVVNTTITLVPAPSKIVCVIPNPTKFAGIGANPARPVQVAVTVNTASTFTINSTFPGGTGIIVWLAIAQQ